MQRSWPRELQGTGSSVPRRLFCYMWHPGDYRADTRHLTCLQHGAYREIIDEIFWSGQEHDPPSIADDDAMVARLTKLSVKEWREMRDVLIDGALLVSKDGRLSQKRLAAEITKALDKCGKNQANALKRWQDRPETARHATKSPQASPGHGGNGHGQTMSQKQYLFFASKIGQWQLESQHLFVGATDASEFERAFLAQFGMSWASWKREQAIHATA